MLMPITLVFALTLVGAGCSSTIDSLTLRPTNVRVSQGDFNESIRITWDAVIPTDGRVVDYYSVVRLPNSGQTNLGGGARVDASRTSYVDDGRSFGPVDNGTPYTYQVLTFFTDGTFSIPSIAIQGYALDQQRLSLYQAETSPQWSSRSSGEGWYTAFLLAGWNYDIYLDPVPDPAPGTGFSPEIKIYRRGDIVEAIETIGTPSGSNRFTPAATADYHFFIDSDNTTTRFRMRVTY